MERSIFLFSALQLVSENGSQCELHTRMDSIYDRLKMGQFLKFLEIIHGIKPKSISLSYSDFRLLFSSFFFKFIATIQYRPIARVGFQRCVSVSSVHSSGTDAHRRPGKKNTSPF